VPLLGEGGVGSFPGVKCGEDPTQATPRARNRVPSIGLLCHLRHGYSRQVPLFSFVKLPRVELDIVDPPS
jgi:hypothetical protein